MGMTKREGLPIAASRPRVWSGAALDPSMDLLNATRQADDNRRINTGEYWRITSICYDLLYVFKGTPFGRARPSGPSRVQMGDRESTEG
jgi:hypothetical protein